MPVSRNTAFSPAISVCMTAYNEEAVVARTLRDCLSVLAGLPGRHEILMVNDGSTDRTGHILGQMEARHPCLRVLTHPENQGFVRAQRWLIREARGDLIFHFAADGEWRASEIFPMLERLNRGADIVIGVRRNKQYTPYRLAISWLYNTLIFLLFGKHFHDIGSIRLARAALWKNLPAHANSAFFIAEKILLAHRNRARIAFVPVAHVWRSSGKSKFSHPLRAVEAFVDLFRFRQSPRSRRKVGVTRRIPQRLGASSRENRRLKGTMA